ncbi:MAG: NADH-quinone oxidoreductase subunit N [Deltaproteobacteria bacterium]|nr:NADH-quinone oxidoreductase subunit N [Deltaproteobacteria bacterium]
MNLASLNINIYSLLPLLMVVGLALFVLVLDFFIPRGGKRALGYVSALGLVCILPFVPMFIETVPSYAGFVIADTYSAFFNVVFLVSSAFAIFISIDYLRRLGSESGEYYYIMLFATAGMMIMASANDLIGLYVGLELMSMSFYILVALRPGKGAEGALKYFVLGAMSSGILLYGISFAYGFSGTTNVNEMAAIVYRLPDNNTYLYLALALIGAGFAFKIAAFPFHVWSPDAYEGAPTPVTALLSVGSKAAAFAVFLRVFAVALPAFHGQWSDMLWVISAATMIFGSVVAIPQKNIIRMLAYSSIAHAGVILMGIVVNSSAGASAVLYYSLVYAFMNVGAFTVAALASRGDGGEQLTDLRGLASRRPWLAFFMALFMVSLAGIPPTAGFMAKFFVLASAVHAGYYWLAVIAVISTAIALFFYARVIFYMYMRDYEGAELPERSLFTCVTYGVVLILTAVGTLALGVYPSAILDIAVRAVGPLFTI